MGWVEEDVYMKMRERLLAVTTEAEESKHLLFCLLAVIHRDGGHYATEHGTVKATKDAINVICAERLVEF